jgi:hypothetical protein
MFGLACKTTRNAGEHIKRGAQKVGVVAFAVCGSYPEIPDNCVLL